MVSLENLSSLITFDIYVNEVDSRAIFYDWWLQVMALLHQGNQSRTTELTRVNETSSRSHAILQVMVL